MGVCSICLEVLRDGSFLAEMASWAPQCGDVFHWCCLNMSIRTKHAGEEEEIPMQKSTPCPVCLTPIYSIRSHVEGMRLRINAGFEESQSVEASMTSVQNLLRSVEAKVGHIGNSLQRANKVKLLEDLSRKKDSELDNIRGMMRDAHQQLAYNSQLKNAEIDSLNLNLRAVVTQFNQARAKAMDVEDDTQALRARLATSTQEVNSLAKQLKIAVTRAEGFDRAMARIHQLEAKFKEVDGNETDVVIKEQHTGMESSYVNESLAAKSYVTVTPILVKDGSGT